DVKDGRSRQDGGKRLFLRYPALLAFLLFATPAALLRAQEDPECVAALEGAPDPAPDGAVTEEAPPPPAEPGLAARVVAAVKEEVKRYGRDSVAIAKAPLYWKEKDWEKAAGAVIIVGGLMLADRDIDKAAQRNRSDFTNH